MAEKIEVWITDLYILNIAGEHETIRLLFPDPSSARAALERLLVSSDCEHWGPH